MCVCVCVCVYVEVRMYPFAAHWIHPVAGQFLYRKKTEYFLYGALAHAGLANGPCNEPTVTLTIKRLCQPFANHCGDRMPICTPNSRPI